MSGSAEGKKSGTPVTESVEWLVDTGAGVGALRKNLADKFDTKPLAFSASPTTGTTAIQMASGVTVKFRVEDRQGNLRTESSAGPVAIKSDNRGSNLIGMDQIADVGAEVDWNPQSRSGTLWA